MIPRRSDWISILLLLLASCSLPKAACFSTWTPPSFGLASLLFPVRNAQVVSFTELSQQDPSFNSRATMVQASDFFVDAFWTNKVGGGAKQLSSSQLRDLRRSQLAEFNKRYAPRFLDEYSQFFVVQDNDDNDNILACVGIELDVIRAEGLSSPQILERSAPLMSNLAVSPACRRRGLAEQLVQTVEEYIIETWPEQEACYLLVEARNKRAVRLYEKLGYETIWADDEAETLLPTSNGKMAMDPTTILCMKKNLRGGNNPFAALFRR